MANAAMGLPATDPGAPGPRRVEVRALRLDVAQQDSLRPRVPAGDRWLASDKASHLASCAFLTAGGFYFLHQEQDVARRQSLLLAGGVAFAMGIGKELYDRRHPPHVASWKDLLADVVGIGVAVLILR